MNPSPIASDRKVDFLKAPAHFVNFGVGFLAHLLTGADARFASTPLN